MYARRTAFHILIALALVLGFGASALPIGSVSAFGPSIVLVDNLAPSWDAAGGGGVYSAYIGPPAYGYVSPGFTAVFDGLEAGIIKAGLAVDPTSGHYEDEGLFGFKPNMTIDQFAAGPVSYDVETQAGVNPVWMTIEIDTGAVDVRSDNTTYQYVPTTNPAGWHTVDGVAGMWQKWNNNQGDVTGNPLISLADVAAAHSGLNVVRAYLRLGMGDSYNNGGSGTIAWVDKVTIGAVTYDFVTAKYWYVSPAGLDTNEGTEASPFLTIQHAIDAAANGDTVHVMAGTYVENVNVNKEVTLQGPGVNRDFTGPILVGPVAAPNTWYTDRYAPAVFESAAFDGKTVLKHGVRVADSAANRPPAYSGTFYNTQGRKLDVNLTGPEQTFSIDLWVDPSWTTGQQTAGLWGTGFDATNAVSAYPILTWRNNGTDSAGFYGWNYVDGGYIPLIIAAPEDYGRWHTLSYKLTPGVGLEYMIDGVSVYTNVDADTVSLGNVILNVYNFGADYDVYWDNFATYDSKIVGQMTINASNVKVDGFDMTNPNQAYGMLINTGFSNIDITNNTFEDIGGTAFANNVKGIYMLNGPDDILIEGNIFRNIHAGTKSVNAVYSGDSNSPNPVNGLVIRNNTFENITSATKGGYGILLNNGAGNTGVVITGNAFSGISGSWTHAIGLEGPTPAAVVQSNDFTDLTATGADNSAVFFEANPVGGTVDVSLNHFNGSGFYGVAIHPTNAGGTYTVDASPNWFGSNMGPSATQIFGTVTASPWCAIPDCSILNPYTLQAGEKLQNVLDTVPAYTTIIVPDLGDYTDGGSTGYHIDTPHLTIILQDGTVIQNSSPCFTVNISYTTITTDTIGGAKCVPTNSSNGIDVASTLVNVIIEGIEFDGTGQTTGAGINFAGAITDVQVIDNYFHDLTGSGIVFGGPVSNNQGIQGNLFQRVAAPAIVSSTAGLNAEFNSWDALTGATLANVDSDPWTHVDLFMTSSGTPWANQVANVATNTITYTVSANLQNTVGADFVLTYDPAVVSIDSTAAGTYFDPVPGETSVLDTTVPGQIHFIGYKIPAVSGANLTLFTVTFKPVAPGTSALNLVETTDLFSMYPGYGPSSNIYAAALVDGSVTVIGLPTLTSASLTDTYIIGTPNEFTLTINNPTTGAVFTDPALVFTLPAGSVLEYDYGAGWVSVTGPFDPGTLAASGTDVTLTFRLTLLVGPGSYPLTVDLYDTLPTQDALLATTTANATVTALPAVTGTISMQGRTTRAGVPMTLTALNFTTYGPFTSTSIEQISGNISFSGLASDTYRITTNQPRYLNLTAAENKTKLFSATVLTILPLELKGGNAVWTDNTIGLGDASLVGTQYGASGTTFDGDVNFTGKVDVFDLAMVGGNFGFTSAGVYATWIP